MPDANKPQKARSPLVVRGARDGDNPRGAGFTAAGSLGVAAQGDRMFVFNGSRSLIAIALLLLIGPLGGMVSIIYAVRIEPLKALRLG